MSSQDLNLMIEMLKKQLQAAQDKHIEAKKRYEELESSIKRLRTQRNEKILKLETKPLDATKDDLKSLVEDVEALDQKRQQIQKQIKMYTEPSNIECDTLYLEYMNAVEFHSEAHIPRSNKESLTPEDDLSERLKQLNQAIDELTQENFELQQKLESSRP